MTGEKYSSTSCVLLRHNNHMLSPCDWRVWLPICSRMPSLSPGWCPWRPKRKSSPPVRTCSAAFVRSHEAACRIVSHQVNGRVFELDPFYGDIGVHVRAVGQVHLHRRAASRRLQDRRGVPQSLPLSIGDQQQFSALLHTLCRATEARHGPAAGAAANAGIR